MKLNEESINEVEDMEESTFSEPEDELKDTAVTEPETEVEPVFPYVIRFPAIKVREVKPAYERLCPICGNGLTLEELRSGRCSKYHVPFTEVKWIAKLRDVEEFFRRAFGSDMRTIQRSWARKLILGLSFGITAPTGTGKTVFGLMMSLLYRNSLIIFPTKALVLQAQRVISQALDRLQENIKVVFYHGDLKKSEKEESLKRIEEGDYDVLVVTNQFLVTHFQLISDRRFKLIFVDDLDSMARSSRNVDKILTLLGFSSYDIWRAKNFKNVRKISFPKPEGQLMISSATLKRGENTKLFMRLLGFDVGTSQNYLRKVYDVSAGPKDRSKLRELLEHLGSGGLIYTTSQEEAEELTNWLKEQGFKVELVSSKSSKAIEKFANDELDYLVGVATSYGILVRGIDLPLKVRYAVFWGLPKRAIDLQDLSKYGEGSPVLRLLGRVFLGKLRPKLEDLERAIEDHPEGIISTFVLKDKKLYSIDLNTYIQATGRTSRFMAWGITRGLSLIFEEGEFIEAMKKLSYIHNFELLELSEVDLEEVKRELEETRIPKDVNVLSDLKTYLLIVESPTKARQIASFFGKPASIRIGKATGYEVASPWGIITVMPSFGHVTDLTVGKGLDGVELEGTKLIPVFEPIMRCEDCGHQFVAGFSLMPPKPFEVKAFATYITHTIEDIWLPPWMEPIIFRGLMAPYETQELRRCPICGSPNLRDSKEHIEGLRRAAFILENVIVATDPDNEGEKISFDLKNLLSGFWKVSYRARFHEITKRALEEAMNSLTDVDENLVNSQLARRVEDRWIGFRLSGELQQRFKHHNLSAGRVQTPVLGWVVERFEKHQTEKVAYTHLTDINVTLDGIKISGNVEVEIEELERRDEEIYVKPFNTSDMLIEASRILKLSTTQAMRYAQHLFERGLITYHRTDSYHISDKGIAVARQVLGEHFKYRNYPEVGAHETIRPTKPLTFDDVRMNYEMEWGALRLYDLIFRRFIASQCGPVKLTYQRVKIKVRGSKGEELEGEHTRVIGAEGKALEYYQWIAWVKEPLKPGKYEMKAKGGKRPTVPLLTQADLVRMMKERGIGRPSTYSSIIAKLFKRGYIFENKVGKIIPTKTGREVYYFLRDRFGEFVAEERTRQLQEKMDLIERGEAKLNEVLTELLEEIASIGE